MAVYRLFADVINGGGTGAMDGIDPTDIEGDATSLALTAGSTCEVIDKTNKLKADYYADNTGGLSEDFPNIIIPDTNPGNWAWILLKLEYDYEGPINSALGYAQTPSAF